MTWKTRHRSFYYANAPEPDDPVIERASTALLCIDVQNYGLALHEDPAERARWAPFQTRMHGTVMPRLRALQDSFRAHGIDVLHARIACLLADGRDRSLSQKLPGWNNLLMPLDSEASQIAAEVAPAPGEIVVTKTTDSALTGTNLRLVLANMGIRTVVVAGIYTDQCVSSTVRSLADESFNVVVVEDCCAAASEERHAHRPRPLHPPRRPRPAADRRDAGCNRSGLRIRRDRDQRGQRRRNRTGAARL